MSRSPAQAGYKGDARDVGPAAYGRVDAGFNGLSPPGTMVIIP